LPLPLQWLFASPILLFFFFSCGCRSHPFPCLAAMPSLFQEPFSQCLSTTSLFLVPVRLFLFFSRTCFFSQSSLVKTPPSSFFLSVFSLAPVRGVFSPIVGNHLVDAAALSFWTFLSPLEFIIQGCSSWALAPPPRVAASFFLGLDEFAVAVFSFFPTGFEALPPVGGPLPPLP